MSRKFTSIQVLMEPSMEDIMKNPEEYISMEEEVVLTKLYAKGDNNATLIIVGQDKDSYYFVVEDNGTSECVCCTKDKIADTYNEILYKLLQEV